MTPDAINFDALSPNACARVLELRKRWKICLKCGGTFSYVDLLEANEYGEGEDHIGQTKGGTLYRCGPVISLPVYVRRHGNGWQVGTQDLPGWALVLG